MQYVGLVNKIKLIMFDFDGTLVDTAPDIIAATNQLLEKHNHTPLAPEVIRQDIGTGLKKLLLDFFPEAQSRPDLEQQLTDEFLEIYRSLYLNSPRAFPGLENFLLNEASRQNYKLAIVSNKKEELIHPILEKLKLDRWPWVKIIGGDTFSTMKPDPQPILAAIQAAQVETHESVLVGDGIPDIQGARAVGCYSLAVSFGYAPIDLLMRMGAHGRLNHFDELPSQLDFLVAQV